MNLFLSYNPGSPERKLLEEELITQKNTVIDIPLIIGGKEIRTGKTGKVVMPSDHQPCSCNLSHGYRKRGFSCHKGSS